MRVYAFMYIKGRHTQMFPNTNPNPNAANDTTYTHPNPDPTPSRCWPMISQACGRLVPAKVIPGNSRKYYEYMQGVRTANGNDLSARTLVAVLKVEMLQALARGSNKFPDHHAAFGLYPVGRVMVGLSVNNCQMRRGCRRGCSQTLAARPSTSLVRMRTFRSGTGSSSDFIQLLKLAECRDHGIPDSLLSLESLLSEDSKDKGAQARAGP